MLGTFTTVMQGEGQLSYTVADGGILSQFHVLRIERDNDFGPTIWNEMPEVLSDVVNVPAPAGVVPLLLVPFVLRRRRG